MERRGFTFKDGEKESFDDIANNYYTPEELEKRNKWKREQFGEDVEGL